MDLELQGIDTLKSEEIGHVFKPWVSSHWGRRWQSWKSKKDYIKLDLIVYTMEFESYLKQNGKILEAVNKCGLEN